MKRSVEEEDFLMIYHHNTTWHNAGQDWLYSQYLAMEVQVSGLSMSATLKTSVLKLPVCP